MTLPPRAQAHVDALDANGATVALEEGTVEVSVVHRAQTRWEIRAGRYQIRVTGTKFSAGWDRRTDTLTVTMREGSVEVTGPGLKAPARVVGGQRLRANGVTADRRAIHLRSWSRTRRPRPARQRTGDAPAPAVRRSRPKRRSSPTPSRPSRKRS